MTEQTIEQKIKEREYYNSANPPVKLNEKAYNKLKELKSIDEMIEFNKQQMIKMERDIVASFIDIEFFEGLGAYELRKIVNFLREMVVKKEDEEEEEVI